MGDIAVRGGMNLDEIQRWGKVFIASGIFGGQGDPQMKMAQAIIKIQYGQELGLPPFAAMDGIDIIDGKPAPNAGLTAALIKRSGKYDYKITESSSRGCHLEWTENGQVVGVSSFIEDDARAAGLLSKTNWQKYPVDMYFSRALTRGARRFCADLFLGSVYTPEELGGDIDGPPEPVPGPQPESLPPIPMARAGGQRRIAWTSMDDIDEPPLEDRMVDPVSDAGIKMVADDRVPPGVAVMTSADKDGNPLDAVMMNVEGPTAFEAEGAEIDEAIAARMGEIEAGTRTAADKRERDFFGEKLQQLAAAPDPTDLDWCESVLVKICANLDAAKTAEEAMRMRAFIVHLPEPYKQQAKDTIEETIAAFSRDGDADAMVLSHLIATVENCANRGEVKAVMDQAQKLSLPPETWRAFYAAAQGKMVTFKPEPLAKRTGGRRAASK